MHSVHRTHKNKSWNKVILSELPAHTYFYSCKEISFLECYRHCARNPCFLTRIVRPQNIPPFPTSTPSRFLGLQLFSDVKRMLYRDGITTVFPLLSCCHAWGSRSLEPILKGMFIRTDTYFILANLNKTKYILHLKFVSKFKCYMEFRLPPFSSLFTQLSVGLTLFVGYTPLQD
jgi:hypothetical protein